MVAIPPWTPLVQPHQSTSQPSSGRAEQDRSAFVTRKGQRFTSGIEDTLRTLATYLDNALHTIDPRGNKYAAVKSARRYLEHDWRVLKQTISATELGQFQQAYNRASNELLLHEKVLGLVSESTQKLPE